MDPIFAISIPKISLAAEELFHIGPLQITNANLTMLIVMIAIAVFFITSTRKLSMVPGRRQALVEFSVESLLNFTTATSGNPRLARKIFPLIFTLFVFILCANYAGLLPGVGSIYVKKDVPVPATVSVAQLTPAERQAEDIIQKSDGKFYYHDEKVPIFRAPNADLNMTLAMALIVTVLVQYYGIQANGAGYFREFKNPMAVIEVFSRILSLSLRLFGNIFGGEVLVTVMYALTFVFVPTLFLVLELFFGFIQALVFAVLTIIFISLAATEHEGGHGAHDGSEPDERSPIATDLAAAPLGGGD